jgi:hypothetical protein
MFAPKECAFLLGCVLLLALLLAPKWNSATGLTSLIQFGQDFETRRVPALAGVPHAIHPATGYDGQFYAQLALDPAFRSPAYQHALDDPRYRARRIFLPALGYIAGAGQPSAIIARFPFLNIAFWLGLLVLLVVVSRPHAFPLRMAAILAMVFSTGALESLRLCLTDLPMATLAFAGACLIARGRPVSAGVALACACLTRETGLLAAAACFAEPNRPAWRRNLIRLGLTILPALLWFIWVVYRFPSPARELGLHNFAPPFLAIAERLDAAVLVLETRVSIQEIFTVIAVFSLLVQAFYLLRRPNWANPVWRLGAVFAVLLPFLGPAVWEVHMAACRLLLPMSFAFNWLLLAESNRARWTWFAAGNLYALYGIIKMLLV